MHLGVILIGIIGLHQKEIGALVNINLLDTRNNSIGQALLASAEVNKNESYAGVRPEKFQFLEKGQNRKFDYKIVISVKNP